MFPTEPVLGKYMGLKPNRSDITLPRMKWNECEL